jgi:hypothetical protein
MKRDASGTSEAVALAIASVSEEDLSARLGVDREKIKNARPAHVVRVGNAICWLQDDAQKFAERIGLPLVPPALEDKVLLTVYSNPGPNGFHYGKHNIQAKTPAGEIVNVRVTDSSKFRQKLQNGEPMRFWAVRCVGMPHYLLASREPLRPGIW